MALFYSLRNLLQGRNVRWWAVVEGAIEGQCCDWSTGSDCYMCKVTPLQISLVVCCHHSLKAGRSTKQDSGLQTQVLIVTKSNGKRELQNWAWLHIQVLSHANLCVGLTSTFILVSRKWACLHQHELNQPFYYAMQICKVKTCELQVSSFHKLSLPMLTKSNDQT